MKRGKRIAAGLSAMTLLAAQVSGSSAPTVTAAAAHDYAKALQMSLYFYECQQAGELPEWNRVEWRANSTVGDDLNGGWYDAGDHVKFNLPMSYSASMLAWGLYEYGDGVETCGEMTNYINNLKWVLDYLAACDLGDTVIYQVGLGQKDHTWWGACELLEYGMADQGITDKRGHLEGRNCSAVTAQMGAALAAGYCALDGRVSSSVRDGYLKHAKNFFAMADEDKSDETYQDSDPANGFYSSSHFYDELFWCANWLYIATGDQSYLDKASSYIPHLGTELGQGDTLKYSWCQCWDDVQQGGSLLYAINTGEEKWITQVRKHLDYWLDSQDIVPGGLRYVGTWGCLRYATSVGFVTAVACDRLFANDAKYADYKKMYETQINFCFGDNPNQQCYVVGYNENSPRNPHHRTAHGSWKNSDADPVESRHILYGALVGGPNKDGSYEDDRNNYINNEVATDYNAGYTALLCKMVSEYGGKSDPAFPYPETRDDEFFVEAKVTSDAGGSTVSMKLTNHTAWPARVVDNLSMRYYMDLSELTKAGVDPKTVEMRCDRDQSAMYGGEGVATAIISGIQQYKDDIYYVEITFPDGRAMLPISEGRHQCEILLALIYPNYGKGWDATNDYSAQGIGSEKNTKTKYIPVYENGTLIYGVEPDGTTGNGSISAAPSPDGSTRPSTPPTTTEEPVVTTTAPAKTTSIGGTPAKILYGDVDCDGSVELADAVMLAKAIGQVGDTDLSVEGRANAQVYSDNNVDGNDLRVLLGLIAGLYEQSEMPIKP